jgi:hypothetical protein
MGWEGFLQVKISSTWTTIPYVTDTVNLDDSPEAIDTTSRADAGNNTSEPGSFDTVITFKIQKVASDTTFAALRTAHRTRAVAEIRYSDTDPATVGSDVYTASMKVFKFSESQPIKGVQTYDIEVRPCPAAVNPTRATTS